MTTLNGKRIQNILLEISENTLLLHVLKSYHAPQDDLKTFYTAVIRSTLEYGTQVGNGGLTRKQSQDIEKIQKRALRIIYAEYDYEQALIVTKLKSLKSRRDDMCVELIRYMSNPAHKLHNLFPKKVDQIRAKTRSNGQKFYNFKCNTERFKQSPVVFGIEKYNAYLDDD